MYIKTENSEFRGFFLEKNNDGNYIEISDDEYRNLLEESSKGKGILIENGKIQIVELSSCEEIKGGKIVFNKPQKIENLLKELKKIQVEYSESEFIFQEKYKQKNRELDQNNLSKLITMFIVIGKQPLIKGWKFKDLNGQDVYTDLTAQDAMTLAQAMEMQTKKSMHVETTLHQKIIAMSDEELKEIDLRVEFVKLWDTIKI